MNSSLEYPDCPSIVHLYTDGLQAMFGKSGGQIRGAKGKLVESIVDAITRLAWHEIGGDAKRFDIRKRIWNIPINEDYVNNLKADYLRMYIQENKEKYFYKIEMDRVISIDTEPILSIECKSYMDNTMLRRTLKDFELIVKLLYPKLLFTVFQLENGLGGDYGEVSKLNRLGSQSTHTLLSYTPEIDLEIITLLDGKISNRTLHDPKYFKELPVENVEICVNKFKNILKSFV